MPVHRIPSRPRRAGGAWRPHAAMLCAALVAGAPHAARAQAPAAASTYYIGQGEVPGARQFATPSAFSNAVKCVRGGDRIWLESGRSFHDRLKLIECTSAGADAREAVEVRSFDPRQPQSPAARPATLVGSENAATLGLAWRQVPAADASALGVTARRATQLFALGPLQARATGLLLDGRWLTPAAHPNAEESTAQQPMGATAALASRNGACSQALCATTQDPEALQVLQRLQATDRRNWPLLVFRNSPWSLSRHTLGDIDGAAGVLRTSDPAFGPGLPTSKLPEVGSGLLLVGSTALIDQPGEWAFDAASNTVYLLRAAGDTPPDAARTELMLPVDQGNDGFMFSNAVLAFWGRPAQGSPGRDLRIDNVAVRGGAGSGVRVLHAGSIALSRLDVQQVGEHGIVIFRATGPVSIVDSRIDDVARNGIAISAAAELLIRGNTVRHAGRIGLQSALGMDFNGILASGFETITVEGNAISDAGFAGIALGESRPKPGDTLRLKLRVTGNQVDGFCRLLNDCGAIYVNGQVPAGSKPEAAAARDKQIRNNRITRPLGNLAGLPLQARTPPAGTDKSGSWRRFVAAVYLDHGASGYDVSGNEVTGLYEPYSWRVFNRGVENTCDGAALAQCSAQGGYACYTGALERCNRTGGATRR